MHDNNFNSFYGGVSWITSYYKQHYNRSVDSLDTANDNDYYPIYEMILRINYVDGEHEKFINENG